MDNIGKIKHAELDFHGITVVAGNNNTGKSTIGKTLYGIFNSLRNLDAKVEYERNNEKYEALTDTIANWTFGSKGRSYKLPYTFFLHDDVVLDFNDRKSVEAEVKEVFNRTHVTVKDEDALFSELWQKIDEVDKVKSEDIISILIERKFLPVFNGQVNSLFAKDSGKIVADIQNKQVVISFKDNKVADKQVPLRIVNKAIFIQDPNIVNSLDRGKTYFDDNPEAVESVDDYLLYLLTHDNKQSAVAEAQARRKLQEVYALLENVIPGQLTKDSNGNFIYDEKGFDESLNLANLSTGLKSFTLLYMLLNRGALTDKDVLILDEPEVHLHPEWQLKYAELVVLLEKVFHLTILLTTHSPYFLRAIEMFSRKYGLTKDCDYYLATLNDNGNAEFQHVNDDIESIYKEMAEPFEVLNDIDDNFHGDEDHE